MERLHSSTDEGGREIVLYLAHVDSLDGWPQLVTDMPVRSGEGFALLVAGEQKSASTDTIAELAEWCIDHGTFSVAAWGPGCERLHDIFDEVDVHLSLAPERQADHSVVMTSWHAHETLSEAMDFFWTWSFPSEGKAWGPARVVLVVGSTSTADDIRAWVTRQQ